MEFKKLRNVSNVSCMTTGTHALASTTPVNRRKGRRPTTTTSSGAAHARGWLAWVQRRPSPKLPENRPRWLQLRGCLQCCGGKLTRCRPGLDPHREADGSDGVSAPTIWGSAFKLGCSACHFLLLATGRLVDMLPGSPVRRRHRLPARLSFCSVSRLFFSVTSR